MPLGGGTVKHRGNVSSETLDCNRFTGERAAGVIAQGERVAPTLAQIGLSRDLVERYANSLEDEGAILVAVRADEQAQSSSIQQILQKAGAEATGVSGNFVPIEHPEPKTISVGLAKPSDPNLNPAQ